MPASVNRTTLEKFAKNSKLLSLLDEAGIERLAAHGVLMPFTPETVVVRQGEAGGTFYLIASGQVRVLVAEAGDKEVARLGPGMFFGEMAVITRQPRSATVATTEPTDLICFSREPVVQILRDYPKVREFLGSIGLSRTEENINHMLDSDDEGLAGLLEGDEAPIDEDLLLVDDVDDVDDDENEEADKKDPLK